MKLIKIAAIVCLSGLFTVQIASAATLNISNKTAYDLAFTVNGVCSNEIGKVPAYSVKAVSEADFKKACGKEDDCLVQAYKNFCYTAYAGGVVYTETPAGVLVDHGDDSCLGIMASVKPGELNLFYNQCEGTK